MLTAAAYPQFVEELEGIAEAAGLPFEEVSLLTERRAWIGRGRPCETRWHEHSLEPWPGTPPGAVV